MKIYFVEKYIKAPDRGDQLISECQSHKGYVHIAHGHTVLGSVREEPATSRNGLLEQPSWLHLSLTQFVHAWNVQEWDFR